MSTVLCQVMDMDRAVGFYRDRLGLSPGVVSPYWSDFNLGDVKIGLHPPFEGQMREIGRGWILGIEVDDLKGLREQLQTAGTACSKFHEIPGGCVIDFSDPDGNPIQAMQSGVSAKDLV